MGSVFSVVELRALTHYKNGVTILDEHQVILDRYAAIGFVGFGFNWDTMKPTARITPLGLKHL